MARDYKGPKQVAVHQVGNISNSSSFGGNPQVGRVYATDGISPTLSTMQGGGQEPKILDDNGHKDYQFKPLDIVPTLRSQAHGNEPKVMVREATKQGYAEAVAGDSVNFTQPNSKTRRGRVGSQRANTLETGINQGVVVPVLTPDRLVKRQNGRRFKTNGEPMFTLNTQDRHGVTDWLRIRKLTPRECWRLQGFPEWAFDRAKQAGLSNSQLYKQAGNSVTVPVIKAIAELLRTD